ncbi:MAG: hypothetical protein GY888_07340, partial [Planctomycetaceae bacterium]|nr:hypothetical protein [Planctomycetaceae bacterium]
KLPTLDEYKSAIQAYVERYNSKPQKRLGCSPNDLWAELERTPLETPETAIIRPVESRTVRRWRVHLHNRVYQHAELAKYVKREIQVEYDLHDDSRVWCSDTKVIFDTNARASYAAGRWEQIEQAKKREEGRGRTLFLVYHHVGDTRVRPQHREWGEPDPVIRPADDPFWNTHYPPNGWGCRCSARMATERYMKARSLKPTKDKAMPKWRTEDRINRSTGQIYPDQIPGI